MISEGSCDTDGWSNDAKNTAFLFATGINYNKTKAFYICYISYVNLD